MKDLQICMRHIESCEIDWLRNYLMGEEAYNIYILSNLDNYGLDSENVEFLRSENTDGNPPVILMRFFNSFVIYCAIDEFDNRSIQMEIWKRKHILNDLSCITGKLSCINRLTQRRSDIRCTHILERERSEIYYGNLSEGYTAGLYEKADVENILMHYRYVPEMSNKYGIESKSAIEDIVRNLDSGRLFGIEKNGELVSSIMTTAETSHRAMFINVGTNYAYRRKGFCRYLVDWSCDILFKEGKEAVYIYYDNEAAGSIYKRAGFKFVGEYGRVSVKDII